MSGTPFFVQVLDAQGNTVQTINGYDVDGPVDGITDISYTLEGGVLDEIGEIAFRAPLGTSRNNALAPGCELRVYEADVVGVDGTPVPVAQGIVDTRGVTTNRTGTMADFKCQDLAGELARLTVTSGFATASPPLPVETLSQICNRLVTAMADPTDPTTIWTAANTLATLDGLPFAVFGTSIYGAFTQLAKERFAHIKRGSGRTILFGRFGETSGLRLTNAAADPTQGATADEQRQIFDFQHSFDRKIVNDIVPIGGGPGKVQLDLSLLWGDTTFTGYNPAYPILRRAREDGGGVDGFDYYIEDSASIRGTATTPRYGRYQEPFNRPDIVATGNTAGEQREAAMRLYQIAVAHLLWNSQPHTVLTVTTEGRGDLRGIAGKTVAVDFVDIASGIENDRVTGDFVVMKHLRTWAGNKCTDAWTLSDRGTYQRTAVAEFNGLVQTVDNLAAIPAEQITHFGFSKTKNVDKGFPLTYTLVGSTAVKKVIEAVVTVTTGPMLVPSDLIDHTHDTTTTGLVHDVGNATHPDGSAADVTHDVNALPHDVNALGLQLYESGAPVAFYDPGTKIDIAAGTPPSSAKVLMYDPVGHFFFYQGGGVGTEAPTSSLSLNVGLSHTTSTSGGQGGAVNPTTGGTGGKVAATTGGTGGKVVDKTHTSAPVPATKKKFGYVVGPSPKSATLKVDGLVIATTTTGVLSFDIAAFVNDQSNHALEVDVDGPGEATIDIDVRRHESMIA